MPLARDGHGMQDQSLATLASLFREFLRVCTEEPFTPGDCLCSTLQRPPRCSQAGLIDVEELSECRTAKSLADAVDQSGKQFISASDLVQQPGIATPLGLQAQAFFGTKHRLRRNLATQEVLEVTPAFLRANSSTGNATADAPHDLREEQLHWQVGPARPLTERPDDRALQQIIRVHAVAPA